MTVNTGNITSGPYIGNGAGSTFSYDFRVDDESQLSVYETTDEGVQTLLILTTDYTVAGVGDDGGGIITRVAGNLPVDYEWYIRSNYNDTQLTAFASQGGFFADVHEKAMDKLTFLVQQLQDRWAKRSIHLSDSDSSAESAEMTLPSVTDRASQFLAFDSNGNPVTSAVSIGAISSSIVSDLTTMRSGSVTDNESVLLQSHTTIGDDGGGLFRGVTGAAPTTYTDNNGTIIIPSGGDGSAAWLREYSGAVNVKWFGAKGDGITDDYIAIQATIDTAKSLGIPCEFEKKDYLTSAGIILNGGHYVYGNYARILKAFDGVGLSLTGGASYNYIHQLSVVGSGVGAAAGAASVSNSHGISIASRAKLYDVHSDSHKGHGINVTATTNLNKSDYTVWAASNDRDGIHFSGTQDDISVWKFNGYFQFNYEAGMFVETDVNIRQWEVFVYSESNAVDGISSQVDIGKATSCIFWIYAEETVSSGIEIVLQLNCTNCIIHSTRNNELQDNGTGNEIRAGGNIINGHGETPVVRTFTGVNVSINNAKYLDTEYKGASNRLLYRNRIRGDGDVELHAFDTSTGEYTGIEFNANGDTLRAYTNSVEVARFDKDTTAGNTRFLIYDVDNATLERVSVGAADSGGVGYKLLRIPN